MFVLINRSTERIAKVASDVCFLFIGKWNRSVPVVWCIISQRIKLMCWGTKLAPR